jgi:plastocyanin|tara:strand:- start:1779 stop:2189 length:411 start_codon:yes stop_codon:yes gene_type:complete
LNSINKNSVIIGIVIILLGIGIFLGLDNESMQDNNSAVDEKERREPEEFHVNAVSKTVFEPAMLNLQVGDTVTWTNIDSEVHSVSSSNVTSDGGVYFHKTLLPDETYSVTFDKPGTYFYSCLIKFHGMTGIIRVSE